MITRDAFETTQVCLIVLLLDCLFTLLLQKNLIHQYTYNARRNFFLNSKAILAHCEEEAASNGYAESKAESS